MAEISPNAARFRALDGWRGICALVVAHYHFSISDHLHRFDLAIIAGLCVDLFFVLSGFVIGARYADVLTNWRQVAVFAQRRFARLWPLHVTIIAVLLALQFFHIFSVLDLPKFEPVVFNRQFLVAVFANSLLLNAFGGQGEFFLNTASWSISTEFYTYLICAGLCLVAAKWNGPRLRLVFALGLALISGVALAFLSPFGMEDVWRLSILRCLYCFFVGFLAWHIWRQGWFRVGGTYAEISVIVASVVIIRLMLLTPDLRYLAPWMFALLLMIFAHERGRLSALLKTGPMDRLGRWSYSIYLNHMAIALLFYVALFASRSALAFAGLDMAQRPSSYVLINETVGDVISLAYLFVVVGISAVTYKMIELPGQRFFGPRQKSSVERAQEATTQVQVARL